MTLALPPVLLAIAAMALYALATRRVRVAPLRTAAFIAGAGSAGCLIAWDPASLASHMVQHGLLATVSAPLLVLGRPVTLALQLAPAGRRQQFYEAAARLRGLLDPWVLLGIFVAVQWLVHWPAALAAAESHALVHLGLHLLLMAAAIAFFLPVFGKQPVPRRLSRGRAALHLAVAMPLVDLISVPYVATGRGTAAAAMLAAMAPLGAAALVVAWQALLEEDRAMVRSEAAS